MFVARYSNHIQEDIQRGWSSWNFGEEGFSGSEQDLNEAMSGISDTMPFSISGFDIYPGQQSQFDIRELYTGYWVVVDNENACGLLSCVELDASTLEEAIEEYKGKSYTGDGDCFDASEAKLVWSCPDNEFHIFEI